MALLTGEEVRAKYNINPDTLVSTGGRYDESQFSTPKPASTPNQRSSFMPPSISPVPTSTPIPQVDPNQLLTGEEVRAKYGINPDTLVSEGGKFRASQVLQARGGGSPGLAGGMGLAAIPTIDLASTYKKLTQESGVSAVEEELNTKTKAYNDALNKINDNPYYSEATRVGRAEKLRQNFENEASRLSNAVAAKKADVEMQLNLQTKQFDINSTAAQTALNQFNSLLEMGALDGASNEDIANITKTTGLSSGLIQSAINAKKIAGYTTTTQTFDDGTSEGFVIYTVDPQGNIINQVKQITGTSSKAQSQYSSDPFVSNYLKGIIESNAGKTSSQNIEDIWGSSSTTSQSNQTFRYNA